MHKELEYYRAFGQPAEAWIEFASVPPLEAQITIGESTFTFGTDFFGDSPNKVAQSLAACLNTDLSRTDLTQPNNLSLLIVRQVFAKWYGVRVLLVATFPGSAGNSLGLSTNNDSDPASIIISNSNFGGGTNPVGGGEAVTIADGADTTLGATSDTPVDATNFPTATVISLLKGILVYIDSANNGPSGAVFAQLANADFQDNIPAMLALLTTIGSAQFPNVPSQGSGAPDSGTIRVTPASTQRAINESLATSGGTITGGFRRITLVSSATYAGNVGGVAFPANFTKSWIAPDGDTLSSLVYTVSMGNLVISTIG